MFRHPNRFNLFLSLIGSFSVGSLFPPNGNQYVYLVPLYKDFLPNLQDDWYANTSDSNVAYTLFMKFIYHVLSLSEIRIFGYLNFVLVLIINAGNIFLLLKIVQIVSRNKLLKDFEIVALIVFCLVFTFPDSKSGVAGLYFIQPLLQPSTFGVFFLAGIYLTVRVLTISGDKKQSLIKANSFFLLSLIFHPSLLASFMIVSTTIFTICCIWKQKYAGIFQMQLLFTFIAILFSVLLNPQTLTIFRPNLQVQEALQYFAEVRIPYHVIPSVWFTSAECLRICIILLSCVLVFRRFGRSEITIFCFLISLSVPASAVFVEFTKNTSMELAMPWRISVFLFPLGLIIILLATLEFLMKQEKPFKLVLFCTLTAIALSALSMKRMAIFFILLLLINRMKYIFVHKYLIPIFCLTVTLVVAISGFNNTVRAYRQEPVLINEVFLDNPILRGVGLTPIGADDLRLDHGLAIYVNNQAAPIASPTIVEWQQRIMNASRIYERFDRICHSNIKQQVQWIITPINQLIPTCLGDVEVITGDTWKVIILNEKMNQTVPFVYSWE